MNNDFMSDEENSRAAISSALTHFRILPFAESDARQYVRWFHYADFQPTGILIEPGGVVDYHLTLPPELSVKAQFLVGTPGFNAGGVDTEVPRIYEVDNPDDSVTDSEGGVLWLRVVSDTPGADSLSATFKVSRLHLAHRIAVFIQGETSAEQWPSILCGAQLKRPRAPVQLIGEKVVITAWWITAMRYMDHDPSAVLDEYKDILRIENEMAAIGDGAEQHPPSPLRILVSEKEGGSPNASHFRISLPDYGSSLLTPEGVRGDWGVWHELGHMQHQISWSANALTENSVNIFSLAVQRAQKKYSRVVPYDREAHAFLNSSDPNKKFEDNDEFVRLIMWEQLRAAYGDAFFHRLHRESRSHGNPEPGQGDAQYRHYFMVTSAWAAQHDLTTFFIRWGWHPTTRTLDAIRDLRLPIPEPDPSTLHVKAETQIDAVEPHSDGIEIRGVARPGSRLKTTNDPDMGWYDPEGGITYASASGDFLVVTRRMVDGNAVVKSYDPQTGEALGESNHVPANLQGAAAQFSCCTEHATGADH